MGYSTTYIGSINIDPPLSEQEMQWINAFGKWRHHKVEGLSVYDDTSGYKQNGINARAVAGMVSQKGAERAVAFNECHEQAPGLYCQWIVKEQWSTNAQGKKERKTVLQWDGGDKFYKSDQWLAFLVEHFIGQTPYAKQVDAERFDFLQPHTCSGTIYVIGEQSLEDLRRLSVMENKVLIERGAWKRSWVASEGFEGLDVRAYMENEEDFGQSCVSLYDLHERLEALIKKGTEQQAFSGWEIPCVVPTCDDPEQTARLRAWHEQCHLDRQIDTGSQVQKEQALKRRKLI